MRVQEFVRRWYPVALGAVLGVTAGAVLVAVTPKTYTATTTLFLGSPASADSTGAYSGDLFSQQRASTYTQLVKSRDLAVKVIDDLALSITPEEIASKVSADQIPKTVLVRLSVTDNSAQLAADIANTYTADFPPYVARLETPVGSNRPISDLTVIQKAQAPSSPTSPNSLLYILGGLAGGVLVGFFVQWLLRISDRSVRTSHQLAKAGGAPVLGVIPKRSWHRRRTFDQTPDNSSAYADSIRRLRTNLMYLDVDAPPETIAFISTKSSIGTTATATDLAVALARIGRHVALIETDLRNPRLPRYVREHPNSGLTSVLAGDAELDDALQQLPNSTVDVLFGGPPPDSTSDVLTTDSLGKVLAELRSSHDFVLCETPGFLTAADSAVVGLACGSVVLVAAQGKPKLDEIAEVAGSLRKLGATIIGSVLIEAR